MNTAGANIAFIALRAPQLLPAALAMALLSLAAVAWLYRPQLKSLSGPMYWLPMALRSLAIVALAASLLKPVAMRLESAAERGELLVLVDRSRSMSIVDNRRDTAQDVALAQVLGYIPADTRSDIGGQFFAAIERLSALASDVTGAQDDLEYARVSGHEIEVRMEHLRQAVERYSDRARSISTRAGSSLPDDAPLRHELEALADAPAADARQAWKTRIPERLAHAQSSAAAYQSASDETLYQNNDRVRQACQQVGGMSRFELAQRALLRPDGVLSRLASQGSVAAMGISDQPIPLDISGVGPPSASLGLPPSGYTTDLTGCISQAIAGRRIRAIVLLSDGRQVTGDPTVASGLVPQGVPVFTVATASSTPPRDLSFEDVQVPASVFAGQPFNVRAILKHEGYKGINVLLHLRAPDGQEQTRVVPVAEGPSIAEFNLKLTHAGAQSLELWFDKVDGEVTEENNRVQQWLKVVPQRMKVLLVAGSPEWDFQFVRNAMARSPEVDLKDRVINPGAPKLDVPAREIQQQDVVVLFDVPIKALDAGQWDAVEQLAEREGGSVILAAGGVHLPAEYNKSAPIAVAHLLPYDVVSFTPAWRVWPGEHPEFHFSPTVQGRRLAALRGVDGENMEWGWEQLPGVFRFIQLPDRHGEGWRRSVRPLLTESESGLPVLTEMRLGAGRAFFLGLDETWRWRLKQGDVEMDRFWRQLIAYGADQPYYARNDMLALDADKIAAQPGETIHIRARVSDPALAGMSSSELRVMRDGRVAGTVTLSRLAPAGSGRFAGSVSLPVGDYDLQWSLSRPRAKPVSIHMPIHVAASDQAEMADLSGDEGMLRKLADATGGQFLRLEQVNTLPARLAAAADARRDLSELPLWDGASLFCLVLGCLGVEWALRKYSGLA